MFGHKHATCHKMALWLILHEHAVKMEDKFKAQLVQDYRKTMDEKQKSKLSNFQGTVRQLYINGEIDHADVIPIKLNLKLKVMLDAENPLSSERHKAKGLEG
jgi:hypothetical protein